MKSKYKRVLIKLSGESLQGRGHHSSVCINATDFIAKSIKDLLALEVELGIVIGGGNFFRGALAEEFKLKRTPADHIGMLATVMNGIFLSQALAQRDIKTAVMGSTSFGGIVETFHLGKANEYLENFTVVIFVGGTGNPYFTTDSAAALRSCEIDAEIMLKATKVDGIYDKDPKKFPDAQKYETISYSKALADELKVMDATAIALVREKQIPVYVFNLFDEGSLVKAVCYQEGGTLVS